MAAEVRGEEELDGGLDILGAQSALLLVPDQLGGLKSDLLEHVSHQGVDDGHALLADADIVGNALQDLVDVERERGEVLSLLSLVDLGLLCGALSFRNHVVFLSARVFILAPTLSCILLADLDVKSVTANSQS